MKTNLAYIITRQSDRAHGATRVFANDAMTARAMFIRCWIGQHGEDVSIMSRVRDA